LGLHHSKTRIRCEILSQFFVYMRALNIKLSTLTKACIQCQCNNSAPQTAHFKAIQFCLRSQSNLGSWHPSMTHTHTNGNSVIFVAVDKFTGYIQLRLLKSRKAEELILVSCTEVINELDSWPWQVKLSNVADRWRSSTRNVATTSTSFPGRGWGRWQGPEKTRQAVSWRKRWRSSFWFSGFIKTRMTYTSILTFKGQYFTSSLSGFLFF